MKGKPSSDRIFLADDGERNVSLGEKLGCSIGLMLGIIAFVSLMRFVLSSDAHADQKRADDFKRCEDGRGTYFCSHQCVCFAEGVVLK